MASSFLKLRNTPLQQNNTLSMITNQYLGQRSVFSVPTRRPRKCALTDFHHKLYVACRTSVLYA